MHAMEDLDAQLRPLCDVLARVNAANPGLGTNISLYQFDGVERPVVVVFGNPWVVWLYIDSGTFMLRGGYTSDRVRHPPRPAAVAVGRVGTAADDVPAKILGIARALAAETQEQPAEKYTWMGAGGYVAQMEGKYARLPGQYREMLAPLINTFPISGSLGLPPSQAVTAPSVPALPTLRMNGAIVHHSVPSKDPVPVGANEAEAGAGPSPMPELKSSGRIPGIAGAAALMLAVLPLDYSFYGLIRWVVFVSAIWLISVAANRREYGWMCGYAVAAVLWNPLFPFGFSRASWLMPDLIGAAMMAFGAYAFVSRQREASGR
jgi:hypothetical protein